MHDIVRIGSSKKKLTYFKDEHIYTLDAIPGDFELGEAQHNQVHAHKRGAPIVDSDAIRAALEAYRYPLYFCDYETFAPAIPVCDGYSPYQRIPFQFSLHVLRSPGAALEHVEFLQEELRDPTEAVARLLAEVIDPQGSVVVWYAPFERTVNQEIARRSPLHASVISRINGQLVDLREIFAQQHYVHPEFRGSTSIKAVLPVLVPELSYKSSPFKRVRRRLSSGGRWLRRRRVLRSARRWAVVAGVLRARHIRDVCDLEDVAGVVGAAGELLQLRRRCRCLRG